MNKLSTSAQDRPYTVNELAHEVAAVMGVEPVIDYLPPRNEVLHAWSDHSRVQGSLRCAGRGPLETGLEKMATWALTHGARSTPPFANIEVPRNMPPSWKTEFEPQK